MFSSRSDELGSEIKSVMDITTKSGFIKEQVQQSKSFEAHIYYPFRGCVLDKLQYQKVESQNENSRYRFKCLYLLDIMNRFY